MKKSKILIPALSIASVGAVVAPMVTSCNKNGIEMIDITTEYTPKTTPYVPTSEEASGVDAAAAQKIYLNAISNDKNILREDVLYSYSGFDFSNITMNAYLGVQINNVDTTNAKLDFFMCYHMIYEYAEEKIDATININIEKGNITGFTYDDDKAWVFKVIGTDEWASWNTDTKVTLSGSGYATISGTPYSFTGKQYAITSETKETELDDEGKVLFEMFSDYVTDNFYSYYLKNLKVKA